MDAFPQLAEPRCLATTLGSLPHLDVGAGTALMFERTPEIPAWVQFPKRNLYENMMMQFTEGMPGLVQGDDRTYFDTAASGFTEELTEFYARYLSVVEDDDPMALETFGISSNYAGGFSDFIQGLPHHIALHSVAMLKGQVTGPFTLGTNLLDQDRRAAYYDDQLRDVIVKTILLKARWQLAQMRSFDLPVTIFIDEPSLLGYGSQTFITVSRDDILGDLSEVTETIHVLGALAGIHCEENTDWSMLMESDLDILDFDAYDHLSSIALYPRELRAFLDRGGWLGWGIVPTLSREAAANETVQSLCLRLEAGIERLAQTGIDRGLLLRRALLTPSCGAGGILDESLAARVLQILQELSTTLREKYALGIRD